MSARRQHERRLPVLDGGPVAQSEPLACIKLAYASEAGALAERAGKVQHAYRCRICGAWHLTKSAANYKPMGAKPRWGQ